MAEQRRPKPKIEQHPLVEALVSDPAKPPERTTKLFGLPGKSADPNATRLWFDDDLTSYVEFPNEAIRHSRELPDDEGTIVWVAADAELSYGSVTSHAAQADFLTGSITAAHLGAFPGPAGGPGFPTFGGCPVPTQFPPCGYTVYPGCPPPPTISPTLLPCCKPVTITPWQCPTHQVICRPSVFTRCPSINTICITHSPICHPSALIACPSHQLICPSSPIICNISALTVCQPSTLIQCPTKLGCPSISVPCETTPGCPLPTAGCPIGGDPAGGGFFG